MVRVLFATNQTLIASPPP